MRANDWFDECQGNFFAAGLTYYTIFALFPLLMVGFSVAGFLLSRRPDVLTAIDNKVRAAVPGALGQQMLDLMNSAIDARASVGVIGLSVAVWVGLNWMSNLRVALTEMWRQSNGSHGYIRTKFSDLAAMVSSFVAIFATLALSALAGAAPMARLLGWLGVHDLPVLDAILRAVSVLVSFLLSWLVFGWMIARLPRYPVNFRQFNPGRAARVDRLRTVQDGRSHLSEVGAAQPGWCHLRAGAGSDGVRVRDGTATALRHRMGGDVDGQPARAAGQSRPSPSPSRRACR